MRLEINNQCCTLEQAKKLKALGVPQHAYIHYHEYPEGAHIPTFEGGRRVSMKHALIQQEKPEGWENYYAAFTSAELGEMLPITATSSKQIGLKGALAWTTTFMDMRQNGRTEAESRAAMLLELLENEYYTPAELAKNMWHEG